MADSIYDQQQQRKRGEKWYGEWSATREAILAAKGAREGVIEEEPPQLGFDDFFFWESTVSDKADVMILAAKMKHDRTVVDELFEEKHGLTADAELYREDQ